MPSFAAEQAEVIPRLMRATSRAQSCGCGRSAEFMQSRQGQAVLCALGGCKPHTHLSGAPEANGGDAAQGALLMQHTAVGATQFL